LDYYTGIVYETFLTELPHFGSVCSGGRYNDLAGLYTKEEIPGVGSSIGLDRLLAALEELGSPIVSSASSADVAIFNIDVKHFSHYDRIARAMRKDGLRVTIYLLNKKLGAQYKWAETNAIPFAVLLSEDDVLSSTLTVKNLRTREVHNALSIEAAIALIRKSTRRLTTLGGR
jgi:histidyl-tRNA synthetase